MFYAVSYGINPPTQGEEYQMKPVKKERVDRFVTTLYTNKRGELAGTNKVVLENIKSTVKAINATLPSSKKFRVRQYPRLGRNSTSAWKYASNPRPSPVYEDAQRFDVYVTPYHPSAV